MGVVIIIIVIGSLLLQGRRGIKLGFLGGRFLLLRTRFLRALRTHGLCVLAHCVFDRRKFRMQHGVLFLHLLDLLSPLEVGGLDLG